MQLAELQYDLPPELIAQRPAERRDASRLLVLDRAGGRIEHRVFREIGDYLNPDDCLVLNDTRVIPARFFCRRPTGGRIEGLFLHAEGNSWRALLKPSARLKVGERLACEGSEVALIVHERGPRGEWLVQPEVHVSPLELLAEIGHTPLPPYIHRDEAGPRELVEEDVERYQTVYAERPGAVAAPTAGLHFSPALLNELSQHGVRRAGVTLHVGAGTFVPIATEELAEHEMHAEWFEVTEAAAAAMRSARDAGGRLVAVGTTATRVLESLPRYDSAHDNDKVSGGLSAAGGWTDIFIYPPYRFRNVDRLLTNFHLPGSTLLALVMAFASVEQIRAAYRAAIEQRYRFYSYGDAMLIL
ncbi:MAG: tRNA preQ1(34) S-adenosylmethionine ribosyltransferase-isomerase QueA [Phycisphaerae bacterium]|nr:tRNA preQ1(34) S-adenosylmethionine ribosyltransferase-isomerase QueA [Phycisphaerae bacterium]